jgi:hypothetical protein
MCDYHRSQYSQARPTSEQAAAAVPYMLNVRRLSHDVLLAQWCGVLLAATCDLAATSLCARGLKAHMAQEVAYEAYLPVSHQPPAQLQQCSGHIWHGHSCPQLGPCQACLLQARATCHAHMRPELGTTEAACSTRDQHL